MDVIVISKTYSKKAVNGFRRKKKLRHGAAGCVGLLPCRSPTFLGCASGFVSSTDFTVTSFTVSTCLAKAIAQFSLHSACKKLEPKKYTLLKLLIKLLELQLATSKPATNYVPEIGLKMKLLCYVITLSM